MSIISALRFSNQCNDFGIENEFIYIKGSDVTCKFGFVPCSPKCKEALKILNEYKQIEKIIKSIKSEKT